MQEAAGEIFRITSYNVCYTKLLRSLEQQGGRVMNYPVWQIEFLGGGFLIAVIAILP